MTNCFDREFPGTLAARPQQGAIKTPSAKRQLDRFIGLLLASGSLAFATAPAVSRAGPADARFQGTGRAAAEPGPLPFSEKPDGARALENARTLVALGPKPAGGQGAAAAARHLGRELDLLGMQSITDEFDEITPSGPRTFRNVIGVLPGGIPGTIVLAAHYDTKAGISDDFAGANDSGSGVGAILEIARVARSASRPMPDLMFAFLDGEECAVSYSANDGLHGSRRLAATLVKNGRSAGVLGVIVLDMVGDSRLNLTIPANSSPELRRILLEAASIEGLRTLVRLAPTVILDDHVPFMRMGMPAIDIIDFEYGSGPGLNDYWHTPEDTLDKLSAWSLGAVCRITLRMVDLLSAQVSGPCRTRRQEAGIMMRIAGPVLIPLDFPASSFYVSRPLSNPYRREVLTWLK